MRLRWSQGRRRYDARVVETVMTVLLVLVIVAVAVVGVAGTVVVRLYRG